MLYPPPYSSEVVTAGLLFITQHPTIPAIWMGDFDMTMNLFLDHPVQAGIQSNEPRQTRPSRILTEFALIDVWRYRYPTAIAYTCHSTSHDTMSRIDYILVSEILLPKVTGVGCTLRALSDHSPCWMTASLLNTAPKHVWRLNPYWLSVLTEHKNIERELQFYLFFLSKLPVIQLKMGFV